MSEVSTVQTTWNVQAIILDRNGEGEWFNLHNDQDIPQFAAARERLTWWRSNSDDPTIQFRLRVRNVMTIVSDSYLDCPEIS